MNYEEKRARGEKRFIRKKERMVLISCFFWQNCKQMKKTLFLPLSPSPSPSHFFFRPSTHRCLWSASLVTTPSSPALRIPSSKS